jgi:DNA-binding CsgD family transcriptional regulator
MPRAAGVSPPTREGGLFSVREWSAIARVLRLSDRELQIVRLCAADLKEKAIARQLSISEHTVHTHVERLYRKLGVGSRAALLVRVFATFRALG